MTNEISINIDKGIKLLNEALKRYENGKISAAYKAYQEAGSFLTEANTRANTAEGKISLNSSIHLKNIFPNFPVILKTL